MKGKYVLGLLMGIALIGIGLIIFFLTSPFSAKTNAGNKFFLFFVIGFFFLLGLVVIGIMIYEVKFNNKLDAEGIFTEGEIVSTKKNDDVIFAYIRFIDQNGNEQFFEDCFFSGIRRPGDKVMLSYTFKKNGKVIAQCLDRG